MEWVGIKEPRAARTGLAHCRLDLWRLFRFHGLARILPLWMCGWTALGSNDPSHHFMPLTTHYDVQTHLIWVVGNGDVSMDDRFHCFRQILDSSEYNNGSDVLVDVNRVTNSPVGDEYQTIAKLVTALHSRFTGRIAIVNTRPGYVTTSNLIALSADLSQSFARTFHSEQEAMVWIKQKL